MPGRSEPPGARRRYDARRRRVHDHDDGRARAESGRSAGTWGLSFRERQLIALVAQGQTDVQIVGKLFISISTVRSHLDRIRAQSGCRRRADLTRLALQEGII